MMNTCSILGCKKEATNTCRWCGTRFCKEHPDKGHICYDQIERQAKKKGVLKPCKD